MADAVLFRERVSARLASGVRAMGTSKGRALLLLLIIALGLGLRLYGLSRESLWLDEGHSVRDGSLPLSELLGLRLRVGTHPPLYYIFLHGWIRLFGDSEAAVRSLSALFGVLAIPVAYLLGKRLFGARTGLLGALLVAVSRYHVQYSQEEPACTR